MQQACIFILYVHVSGIQIARPCICRIIVRARPVVFVRQEHAVTAPKCTQHFIDLVTVSIHDHHLSGRRQEPFSIILQTVAIEREGFIGYGSFRSGCAFHAVRICLLVFLKQGRIAGTISENDVCSPELIKHVFDVDVQMSINPQTGKPFFMPFRARQAAAQ